MILTYCMTIEYVCRCLSRGQFHEHSSVRELPLILLESAQHCREPHHWLQPDLLTGIPLSQSLQLPPTATSATVARLRSGVTYNCSIFTITDQGHSQPLTLSNSTSETGTAPNSRKPLWVKHCIFGGYM